MDKKPHHGRNIKRIREIQGIKQEALAIELGDDWNQKKISLLEGKEIIDAELLGQVAKALHVTPEAIENFDEETTIYNIQNNYDGSNAHAVSVSVQTFGCNFNPLDKYVQAIEENKRLYEQLLKEKDEKIALLEKLLNK